jgi:hypothetical protein
VFKLCNYAPLFLLPPFAYLRSEHCSRAHLIHRPASATCCDDRCSAKTNTKNFLRLCVSCFVSVMNGRSFHNCSLYREETAVIVHHTEVSSVTAS